MLESTNNNKPRTVKLWCPSVAKMVPFLARDEQKLDLGSIARVFGLDPSTLRLNGHFISRGVDLVACSVTWRSLLGFFSDKGLSTGKEDRDALVVDGNLCKVGTKRGGGGGGGDHDPEDAAARNRHRTEGQGSGVGKRLQPEDINLPTKNKLKEKDCACEEGQQQQVIKLNGLGFKRKQLLEDVNLLKKLKINETPSEPGERGKNQTSIVSSRLFQCSYMSGSMKRIREDETILAAPCKRIRGYFPSVTAYSQFSKKQKNSQISSVSDYNSSLL